MKDTVRLKLLGKEFACTVCGWKDFFKKKVILKEPGSSLFNAAASNEEAVSLVCTQCGYIHSFLPRFTKTEAAPVDEESSDQPDQSPARS